jgi:hypothetical protein
VVGILRLDLEVADEAVRKDDVHWPRTVELLVGDGDVAAQRVTRFRQYRDSLALG